MRTCVLIAAACLLLMTAVAGADPQNSCLKCHSTLDGAAQAPAHDWPSSVHFRNSIACADCHGGNPRSDDPAEAMSPARGFVGKPSPQQVPDFCGKCHLNVRDNYKQSAHAQALAAGMKAPNCVTCHTAHRQQTVTLDLINPQTCGQCHTYTRAAHLKETVRSAENDLTTAERREDAMFLEGLDVQPEHEALFSVRNQVHGLTHILDTTIIDARMAAVRPQMQSLDSRLGSQERVVRGRQQLGTGLMVFFLVGAGIAWWVHTKLMHEAGAHGDTA